MEDSSPLEKSGENSVCEDCITKSSDIIYQNNNNNNNNSRPARRDPSFEEFPEDEEDQWDIKSLGVLELSSMAIIPKGNPWDYFNNVLKRPKCSVAPMVDASELPFRMLCRKYGADMAWSPMLHSKLFVQHPKYQSRYLTTCPEDRPLAIQFCGNNPEILLRAAKTVEGMCDLVDINFGCPQNIAKRGNYGAFLENQWDTIYSLVNTLYKYLSVPVSCKIRIFKDREKTLQYARMLEQAGCQILTVHGRTKEQKGQQQGLADWSYIKMIKYGKCSSLCPCTPHFSNDSFSLLTFSFKQNKREELSIPVLANGNIRCYDDVDECLRETGADGLMSAEGLLKNPALFSNQNIPPVDLASEYLDFCEMYPTQLFIARAHLYKILRELFDIFPDQRDLLGIADNMQEMRNVISTLRERLLTPSLYDMTPKCTKKKKKNENVENIEEGDLLSKEDGEDILGCSTLFA